MCRFAGMMYVICCWIYMTEVNVNAGGDHLYEGFLYIIAVEISACVLLVIDMWLFSILICIVHAYMLTRLSMGLPSLNDVAIPGILTPLIYMLLVAYIWNSHNKRDFLLREIQLSLFQRIYNLLKAFPERIIISKLSGRFMLNIL